MGNNILDKSAMQTLSELASLMPHMATREDVTELFHQLDKRTTLVEENIKRAIEEEPVRCPFRDAAQKAMEHESDISELQREQKEHGKSIASLETSMKNLAGLNALFAAIASTISGIISSMKP